MSSTESNTVTDSPPADAEQSDLATRVAVLQAENRRLRREYARSRAVTYRKTALALAGCGLVALSAAVLFPLEREVLLVLGGIGVFGAVLTYYLSPERIVSASVGERIYAACAGNIAGIATALGLRDTAIYLPDSAGSVRLFVPFHADPDLPESGQGPFVVDDEHGRGMVLDPIGDALFREFEQVMNGALPAQLPSRSAVLADGLVEQFELATSATHTADAVEGRVTFGISGSAFGDVDRFDHPIPSFLAVGLTRGVDEPVTVEVERGDERADWLVTCRYTPAA